MLSLGHTFSVWFSLEGKIIYWSLQLADDKTFRLHVGKEASFTEIFLDKWKKDNKDKKSEFIDKYEGSSSIETKTKHEYLGLIVSDDGSNKKSIDQKVARAQGIINDIVAIQKHFIFVNSSLKPHYFLGIQCLYHKFFPISK